jgi:hypothetical protein
VAPALHFPTPESKIFPVASFVFASASSLPGYPTYTKNVAPWCSPPVGQARNQLLRSPHIHTHKPSRCSVVHTVQQKLYAVIIVCFSYVDRMCTRNRCKHISIMKSHTFETRLPWTNKHLPIRSVEIYANPTDESTDILPAHHANHLDESMK